MLRCLGQLVVLNGLIGSALAIALTPTATVLNTAPSVAKRDDTIPTIFLGDVSQYIFQPEAPGTDNPLEVGPPEDPSNDEIPEPEKGDVIINPPGFHETMPDDGLIVAFGEDIAGDIAAIVADKCKDEENLQGCVEEIVHLLRGSNLSAHQKRFLPLLAYGTAVVAVRLAAFAAVVAVISIGIAHVTSKNSQAKVQFHGVEDGALDQIHAITDASVVAIATGVDNVVVATVTVTPTPTPTPEPQDTVTIEEITEDNGENKKGDILIHIPDKLEQRLKDYLGVIGIDRVRDACADDAVLIQRAKSGLGKRMPERTARCAEAIAGASTNVIFTAGEDEAGRLVPANENNPMNPEFHPEGAAAPNINFEGANMAVVVARRAFDRGRGNAPPDMRRRHRMFITACIIIEFINRLVMEARDLQARLTLIRMSIDMIVKLTTKQIECSNELVCFSDDCQGYISGERVTPDPEDSELIQTGFCKKIETRGCQCEEVAVPTIRFAPAGYFDELEKFMQELEDSVAHPNCDPNNGLGMDTARFDEAINAACKDHDELRRRKRHGAGLIKRGTFTYENTDKDNLHWKLRWEDEGGQCALRCDDVFNQMLHYDKCRWWGGAAKKGSVPTECGQASYEVDVEAPPPAPGPKLPDKWVQYLILINQQIKPGDWQVEWELFADPWGTNVKVEGPATYLDVGATEFQMHLNVDDAEDKDKSKIRFTLADRFHPEVAHDAPWYAGPGGDMGRPFLGGNWCGLNLDWHEDNGVWKRQIRCAFARLFQAAVLPDEI